MRITGPKVTLMIFIMKIRALSAQIEWKGALYISVHLPFN